MDKHLFEEPIIYPGPFHEVYNRIQIVTETSTQIELANVLGIKQSTVSDAKKRGSIPDSWYLRLFEAKGVNPIWIKTGIGPRYVATMDPNDFVAGSSYQRATIESACKTLLVLIADKVASEDREEILRSVSFKYFVFDEKDTIRQIFSKIMPGALAERLFNKLLQKFSATCEHGPRDMTPSK